MWYGADVERWCSAGDWVPCCLGWRVPYSVAAWARNGLPLSLVCLWARLKAEMCVRGGLSCCCTYNVCAVSSSALL